jgi:hypothetical protein
MHARDTLLRSDESWVISPSQLEVGRIRALTRDRRHAEALAAAEALALTAPQNGEALYLVAANQRCLQRLAGRCMPFDSETCRISTENPPLDARRSRLHGHNCTG